MLSVLSIEQAIKKVLDHTKMQVRIEEKPIIQALGSRLAKSIYAQFSVPHFRRSTVDGYAVYAKDVSGASEASPMLLPLAFEVLMGQGAPRALEPGACAYVPTGGHVPDGADAMVMVEHCQAFGKERVIEKSVAVGDSIVAIGEDVKGGECLLEAGTQLRPHHMGVLAALGYTLVPVIAPIKVALFSTGDEVLQPQSNSFATSPAQFGVYDANASLIAATLLELGAQIVHMGHLIDDPAVFEQGLMDWDQKVDLVILSGGSSAGVRDLTETTILKLPQSDLLVHGLSMQPGKPTLVGTAGQTLYIGLPGHPGACFMTLNAFVKPLIGLLGARAYQDLSAEGDQESMLLWLKTNGPKTCTAELDFYLHGASGRRVFALVTLADGPKGKVARPVYGKSGMVGALAKSVGYIVLSEHVEGYRPGEIVEVHYW